MLFGPSRKLMWVHSPSTRWAPSSPGCSRGAQATTTRTGTEKGMPGFPQAAVHLRHSASSMRLVSSGAEQSLGRWAQVQVTRAWPEGQVCALCHCGDRGLTSRPSPPSRAWGQPCAGPWASAEEEPLCPAALRPRRDLGRARQGPGRQPGPFGPTR